MKRPEDLYFSSLGKGKKYSEPDTERDLQHVVENCEKSLALVIQALDGWSPQVGMVEVEIHKGWWYDSHEYVKDILSDKGWHVEEPSIYEHTVRELTLKLKIYPNKNSQKILCSIGAKLNDLEFPKEPWRLIKLLKLRR